MRFLDSLRSLGMTRGRLTRNDNAPDSPSPADRQPPHAPAGGGEDGVGYGRRGGGEGGLAEAERIRLALDVVDLDPRHLVDAEQRVVGEVALHHATALDGDLLAERGRDAVDDRSLDLRVGARWVDHTS